MGISRISISAKASNSLVKKFDGEITTVEIGDNTTIREFVTVHRGTKDRWKTTVGSNCMILAYSHIAHDCIIGNNCILSNNSQVAGHVVLGDWAIEIGARIEVCQCCGKRLVRD